MSVMWDRKFLVVIGVVVLLVSILTAFAIYPPAPETPDSQFSYNDEGAYQSSGSVILDSETYITYEAAVTENGITYLEAHSEGEYSEEVYEEDGTVYAKTETNDEHYVDRHKQMFGSEIIHQNETNGQVTTILVADNPESSVVESIENWNGLVVDNLQLTSYEQVDNSGSHEPESGWFTTNRDYRITDTSGKIYSNSSTQTVVYANVSFQRTFAGSYLDYLFDSDDSTQYKIEYEYSSDSVDAETPEWVSDVRSDNS